jgi:hypothetical protein
VWVRQPLQLWVRGEECCVELRAFQRRRLVRRVLQHRLRHQEDQVVQARYVRHHLGHQLLPTQLRAPQQQWRLVQPAAPPLRHVTARVDDHRRLPSRYRPGELQEVTNPQMLARHVMSFMH